MCGEMMTFPDTVEEFMEQYKMVDREQIYSNGCEYVPIFRMNQWFAHKPQIDLVRCGECKKHGKNSCPMTFTYAVITDNNNYCSYAERGAE